MPTTPGLALPYPALTDGPDGPLQLRQLAERIEATQWNRPRCKIRTAGGSTQSINNNALTQILFSGGGVVHDNNNMADLVNHQIIIRTTGLYVLNARVAWQSSANGYRALIITRGGADFLVDDYRSATPTQGTIVTLTSEPIALAVNDTINIKVLQSSGGPLNVQDANGRGSHLSAAWVGGQ